MAPKRGLNALDIKRRNRGLALKIACTEEDCSRALIVRKTGLSKMTVTNIVGELISDGILEETDEMHNEMSGRNPVRLSVSKNATQIIGLYISRNGLAAVRSTLDCKFAHKVYHPFGEETAATLARAIKETLTGLLASSPVAVAGIGVAVIGPLDAEKGLLLNPTHFFGISNFDIKGLIEQEFGIKTHVLNDMDASALAEMLFGTGKDERNFAYVGITSGIGAGIISEGKLYQGGKGFSGELGHTSISFDGLPCECGRTGCLELYADMDALKQRFNGAGLEFARPENLQEYYNDAGAGEIFKDYKDKLSVGLANLANLFTPDIIILGHEAAYFPKELVTRIEQQTNTMIYCRKHHSVKLVQSVLRQDSALIGSVCCVLEKMFDGRF